MKAATIKRCFISAPPMTDTAVIEELLRHNNIRLVVANTKTIGTSLARRSQAAIRRADLFIGILDPSNRPNFFFEIGYALALDKRILIISPPELKSMPESLQDLFVIYSDLTNREAIGFAIEQLKQASALSKQARAQGKKKESALVAGSGPRERDVSERPVALTKREQFLYSPQHQQRLAFIDDSLNWLRQASDTATEKDLEEIIFTLLQGYEFSVVTQSKETSNRADIAIWADELQPLVGNPFLIEIKRDLEAPQQIHTIREHLFRYFRGAETHWALLLYLNEQFPAPDRGRFLNGLLVTKFDKFLHDLKEKPFFEVIEDLKNDQVGNEGF
jgi:nucleoside 2-deoxyribosyltransferase